jgi:hypothetical protein
MYNTVEPAFCPVRDMRFCGSDISLPPATAAVRLELPSSIG